MRPRAHLHCSRAKTANRFAGCFETGRATSTRSSRCSGTIGCWRRATGSSARQTRVSTISHIPYCWRPASALARRTRRRRWCSQAMRGGPTDWRGHSLRPGCELKGENSLRPGCERDVFFATRITGNPCHSQPWPSLGTNHLTAVRARSLATAHHQPSSASAPPSPRNASADPRAARTGTSHGP